MMLEITGRYILIILLLILVSSCSEEETASNNAVIDIEVIAPNSSYYGFLPSATHESVLVFEQDYGGVVYNEATDQEINVETHYYETCIDWEKWLGQTQRCRTWGPATNATYEIPLSIGENRVYMDMTRVDAATANPSFIINRVSLSPIEVYYQKNCEDPYLLHEPTLLFGNASDHYICFLFEANIEKIYTILTVSNGKLYFNILDINKNKLADGDAIGWTDDELHFAEVKLDAGQKIYIQIQSSLMFELGVY